MMLAALRFVADTSRMLFASSPTLPSSMKSQLCRITCSAWFYSASPRPGRHCTFAQGNAIGQSLAVLQRGLGVAYASRGDLARAIKLSGRRSAWIQTHQRQSMRLAVS